MYRNLIRLLAATTLLLTFWTSLRIGNITVFDWSAVPTVLALMLYRDQDRASRSDSWPIVGLGLLAIGGLLSASSSSNALEHLQRVAALLVDFSMMISLAYLLSKKRVLTLQEALSVLVISGTVSSFTAILQGRFGMLTSLVPNTPHGIEEWNRLTGLTEHPIEAGITASFCAVIVLGLAFHSGKWFICLLLLAVNVYSLNYSGSVTAYVALGIGLCALCITLRRYLLLTGFAAGITVVMTLALASGVIGAKLGDRLGRFIEDPIHYKTMGYREAQWEHTLYLMDTHTVIFGNGYAKAELPDQKEIHNGPLAALFHFGMFGLAGQCVFIWLFVRELWGRSARAFKGILFGCVLVFGSTYLTGPAMARRPIWVPMFMLAAYLHLQRPAYSRGHLRLQVRRVVSSHQLVRIHLPAEAG